MTELAVMGNTKVRITVLSGRHLLPMDRWGTSDPYVKVMQGDKCLHRTPEKRRTLSPVWNNQFNICMENTFTPIVFQVFDKNLFEADAFMGQGEVNIGGFELDKPCELTLHLEDGDDLDTQVRKSKMRESLGEIVVRVSVSSITPEEQAGMLARRKEVKGIVRLLFVETKGLGDSQIHCKVKCGKEKQRGKFNSSGPLDWIEFACSWQQEVDTFLDITFFHQAEASEEWVGRLHINLEELSWEASHDLWLPVKETEGEVHVVVTVSGTNCQDLRPVSEPHGSDPSTRQREQGRYNILNTFEDVDDIGHLRVSIIMAKGLPASDLCVKCSPFAVVELSNNRLFTHSEQKTLDPMWQKSFEFDIKDINDSLDVTVFDENKDCRYSFLGRARLRLLSLGGGCRMWVGLKDKQLKQKARGEDPQILIETEVKWNPLRAAMKTFSPKVVRYEGRVEKKFKFSVFNRDVSRIKKAATPGFDPDILLEELTRIINWESKRKSSLVLFIYLLFVWHFQPWMLTFVLLLPFIYNLALQSVTGLKGPSSSGRDVSRKDSEEDYPEEEEEFSAVAEAKTDEIKRMSLKKRMLVVEEISLTIQDWLGTGAHLLESLQNLADFSVPFLSWLTVAGIILATLLLLLLPLRLLIMLWGAEKLTKRLFNPEAEFNNEIGNLLSRVPDHEQMKESSHITTKNNALH